MLYSMVLHEKPLDEAFIKSELCDMIDKLDSYNFLLIEIDNPNGGSVAMGVISMDFADKMDFDYRKYGLYSFIGEILADVNKEREDCTYEFKGKRIWLSR